MSTLTSTYQIPPDVGTISKIEDLTLSSYDAIIDVRPYNQFQISHLKDSINMCIPSTLLKRKTFNLINMLNYIEVEAQTKNKISGQIDSESRNRLKILIYDSCSMLGKIGFNLYHTVYKFQQFDDRFAISFLNGGFSKFSENKNCIESSSKTPPTLPVKDKICLSGFHLPSSTSTEQKFVASIKKNTLPKLDVNPTVDSKNDDFDVKKYNYSIKLPDSFEENYDKLPEWLKFLKYSREDVISSLYEKFTKIEKKEQARLISVVAGDMSCHLPSICSPNGLCPSCDKINYKMPKGIEYGFKNRYKNIWPYEHSRVKISNSQEDDYLNANYINNYIATQDPLRETYEDFWNVVILKKVNVIVCLNAHHNNKYYDDQKCGGMEVLNLERVDRENFSVRKIQLTKNDNSKQIVYHLDFKNWPDFGVPKNFNSLLEFIDFKNQLIAANNLNDFVLVHCSAGCGRTGVFIAVDTLINKLREHDPSYWGKEDPIYKLINFQRTQRLSMVQNFDQFIVCYELVTNFLLNFFMKNN